MNIIVKLETETRLMHNIAAWMESHGRVLLDRTRSNAYTNVRILEIFWRERTYRIVEVDGMVCKIERI